MITAHFHVEVLAHRVWSRDTSCVNYQELFAFYGFADEKFNAAEYLRWDGSGSHLDEEMGLRSICFSTGGSRRAYTMSRFDWDCPLFKRLTSGDGNNTIRPADGRAFRLVFDDDFLIDLQEVDAGDDWVVDATTGCPVDLTRSLYDILRSKLDEIAKLHHSHDDSDGDGLHQDG